MNGITTASDGLRQKVGEFTGLFFYGTLLKEAREHRMTQSKFGFGGRGKRGGARVIYLFGGDDVPVFLLAAFAKNEKADLTPAERRALGKHVATMLTDYRRHR